MIYDFFYVSCIGKSVKEISILDYTKLSIIAQVMEWLTSIFLPRFIFHGPSLRFCAFLTEE